ncbi:MAG: hypothetical protein AB7F59_02185 [Bdellovibrionales bacterium]
MKTTMKIFAVVLMLSLTTAAQANRPTATVLRTTILNLQSAQMDVHQTGGIFAPVTTAKVEFGLDIRNQVEFFTATLADFAGTLQTVQFLVTESTIDKCGTKTYKASTRDNQLHIVMTDTPPFCAGIVPQPIWTATIIGLDSQLEISGTPEVVE